jgi:tetrahydromethanopterin S-methyltransferase subunit A
MPGAAVWTVGVVAAVALAPPPHPHNKAPDKKIAAIIAASARMRFLYPLSGEAQTHLSPHPIKAPWNYGRQTFAQEEAPIGECPVPKVRNKTSVVILSERGPKRFSAWGW